MHETFKVLPNYKYTTNLILKIVDNDIIINDNDIINDNNH